jgi:hypothetical protein
MPDKPATPYRKLSAGFDLYYKLTNCQVIRNKPKRVFRPPAVNIASAKAHSGRRGSDILSALPDIRF